MKLYKKDEAGNFVEVAGMTVDDHKAVLESKLGTVRAQAERLEAELAEAKAATASALERYEDATGQLEAANARRSEDVALVRAGIDDDLGMEAARLAWGRLPEEGRGSLVDTVNAWRQAPTEAPRLLQPYLSTPQQPPAPGAPPADGGEQPPAPPAALPKSNNGANGGADPGANRVRWTPERIRAARNDGTYAQHRAEILADVANGDGTR